MKTKTETFSARLKRLRLSAGLTQVALAAAAGLKQNAIAWLECHDADPQLATAKKLAVALGVSLDELAGVTDFS